MPRPTLNLEQDLARQRDFVADAVPSYARVLELLSDALDTDFRDELDSAWEGRTFGAWYERPLLLLAALRRAALDAGEGHPLAQALRDAAPDAKDATLERLLSAIAPEETLLWRSLRQRSVQTNDVSRAVAWRWPASILERRMPGTSIDLHDIGASAGLNLVADHLDGSWIDGAGAPIVSHAPPIGLRKGYDRSPLDLSDPDARAWLRACVWPGQATRLAQLDEALEAYDRLHAAHSAPRLVAATASETPRLLEVPSGAAIAYQTVVRGYLDREESEAYEAGMHQWLIEGKGRALWIELEPARTDEAPDRFAVITAHIARGDDIVDLEIARCHPHPRQLHVDSDAIAQLEALVGSTS